MVVGLGLSYNWVFYLFVLGGFLGFILLFFFSIFYFMVLSSRFRCKFSFLIFFIFCYYMFALF
jgi:hypothetical protein